MTTGSLKKVSPNQSSVKEPNSQRRAQPAAWKGKVRGARHISQERRRDLPCFIVGPIQRERQTVTDDIDRLREEVTRLL